MYRDSMKDKRNSEEVESVTNVNVCYAFYFTRNQLYGLLYSTWRMINL